MPQETNPRALPGGSLRQGLLMALLAVTSHHAFGADADDAIDFNRDIRPILSNNCYACHGPDERTREAGLRLDVEENVFAPLDSGVTPVVPGDRSASELYRRITTDDSSERMPPSDSEHSLTPEQIDSLGRWIDEGAEWAGHWSFIPPARTAVPPVTNNSWASNPIDRFIQARLDEEGLTPRPEADRRTLIRRVTFDLTGLPPTLAEIQAFLEDDSPDAYEHLVDRLLASPRYGEHMGRYWLDLARYADTNGYHIDNERHMWRWRDWVIDAFNNNQPFDEFTVEQLAGDLLPEATLSQKIATGFNRNHMINFEGGAIPEEYRVQYVVDRLDATSTVWMGMTVACAQCHDHKFDPISQREFYQLFAFFNAVPEEGLDGREGNAKPFIKAPLPHQREKLAALDAEIEQIREAMEAPMPDIDAAQAAWETELGETLRARWETLSPVELSSNEGATLTVEDDGAVLVSGNNPDKEVYELTVEAPSTGVTAFRLETFTDESAGGAAGRSESGNFVLSEFEVEAAPNDDPENFRPVPIALANADFSQNAFPIEHAFDGKLATGWAIDGANRRERRTAIFSLAQPLINSNGSIVRIRLHHQTRHAQHAMVRFRISAASDEVLTPARLGPWYVSGPYIAEDGNAAYETAYAPESAIDLTDTYEDGRAKWTRAIPGYADGEVHTLYGDVAATYLYRTVNSNSPRSTSIAIGTNDAVKIWLNGKVVHDNNVQRGIERDQDKLTLNLHKGENTLLMKVVNYGNDYAFSFRRTAEQTGSLPLSVELALAKLPEDRSDAEHAAVRSHYRRENSDEWRGMEKQRAQLAADRDALDAAVPTTMIMGKMETPRDTFILMRGQYDQPGDKVEPEVPGVFPPLPDDAPRDRLGFARWLVDPAHPLTARVVMNRYWQQFFGRGIVKTSEDFGAQGEWPSHPDLLDWLALEFVESGWDLKAMVRLLLTSSTYRQDSRSTSELRRRDPENILLARGPRLRLDAEMVRDNALAVSGLLNGEIGGPSVKPYQPAGIWEEVAYGANFTAQTFEMDKGEDLYRRSMYIFWKRQAPPPQMLLFDAPNRETCTARRARTNTPLQALALLNDPQYVEASRAFAERVLRECGDDSVERLDRAFELVTARKPTDDERRVLLEVLEAQMNAYRANPEEAIALLSVGESEPAVDHDPAELAAWSTVTSMILNLDETITKS